MQIAPGTWTIEKIHDLIASRLQPAPEPAERGQGGEWTESEPPVTYPREQQRFESLSSALTGLGLSPRCRAGIAQLARMFTGHRLGQKARDLVVYYGGDVQLAAVVAGRVASITPAGLNKAAQVATGKRGGRITGYRVVDGKQVPVYGGEGTRQKARPRLDTAHEEMLEAARAHTTSPTDETAARLDAAHEALQAAAAEHNERRLRRQQRADKGADKPAPKPAPAPAAPTPEPAAPAPQAKPTKPIPIDQEPLAAGMGPFEPNPAPVASVRPETDTSAAADERATMRREIERLHEDLAAVSSAVSGELVPMFNALKADLRRMYKAPSPPAVKFAKKKTSAFLTFVSKVVRAMTSMTVRFAKSGKFAEYFSASLACDEVDRAGLTEPASIPFRPMQLALASAALDDAVSREAELVKAVAAAEREREIALYPAQLQPTTSPLHAGEVRLAGGLVARVEVIAGDYRSGVGPDGEWSVLMPVHYGSLVGVDGADGDDLDVFVGPDVTADKVYVATLTTPAGDFDEHKVLVGMRDAVDVALVLDQVYGEARSRVSGYVEMSYAAFLDWVEQQPHRLARSQAFAQVEAARGAVEARLAKSQAQPAVNAREDLLAALAAFTRPR